MIMSGDLLGSRISLISRKDIRWEGILVQVDRENASVTLQNGEFRLGCRFSLIVCRSTTGRTHHMGIWINCASRGTPFVLTTEVS